MPRDKNTPQCKFNKKKQLLPDCCREHLEEVMKFTMFAGHGLTK